jgi:hypothetical protein
MEYYALSILGLLKVPRMNVSTRRVKWTEDLQSKHSKVPKMGVPQRGLEEVERD